MPSNLRHSHVIGFVLSEYSGLHTRKVNLQQQLIQIHALRQTGVTSSWTAIFAKSIIHESINFGSYSKAIQKQRHHVNLHHGLLSHNISLKHVLSFPYRLNNSCCLNPYIEEDQNLSILYLFDLHTMMSNDLATQGQRRHGTVFF